MVLLETHDKVLRSEVGAFVQQCLDAGSLVLVITLNPDGQTCRICVQRD